MRFGLVLLVLAATSRLAAATPWGDRCKARLAKAAPALSAIGKATITIAPPPAPKTGPSDLKNLDAFGEVSLVIKAGERTFTATIGSDHSRHRHRSPRGLVSKRYEEWHSPYVDSLDGDRPDETKQPMFEEFHHRLVVGGTIRAELRVDVVVPATKQKPPNRNPPTKTPTFPGHNKLFADTLRPVFIACWSDVLPDEADVSRVWTTKCLADLAAAHAALVKLDPMFKNGTCAREMFGASCGNVKGAEPTWNAMTSLAGGGKPKLVWMPDGNNRKSYAGGGALIWGSDKMAAAQYAMLFAAFEKPLERCSQLLRTNMYNP
jgi:hypothetical protein